MDKIKNLSNGRVLITKTPYKGAKNTAKFNIRIEYNENGDFLAWKYQGGFIINAGETVGNVDNQLDGMTYFNFKGEALVLDTTDFKKYFNN